VAIEGVEVASEEMKTIRPNDNLFSTGDKLCIAEQQRF